MDRKTALEELLVAEREVMGIEGDLLQNWAEAIEWVRYIAQRTSRSGATIRAKDLAESWRNLGVARARIEGAADEERVLPNTAPTVATTPKDRFRIQTIGHLEGLLKALAEADTLRRWVRDAHAAWAPQQPAPFESLDPFNTGEAHRKQQLELYLPVFTRRRVVPILSGTFLFAAIVVLVARSVMQGS